MQAERQCHSRDDGFERKSLAWTDFLFSVQKSDGIGCQLCSQSLKFFLHVQLFVAILSRSLPQDARSH